MSVWLYRASMEEGTTFRAKVAVPTGFAAFPKEMVNFQPPNSRLARDSNLVHHSKMPRGGHFACFEQPDLFVHDVRMFFQPLRI